RSGCTLTGVVYRHEGKDNSVIPVTHAELRVRYLHNDHLSLDQGSVNKCLWGPGGHFEISGVMSNRELSLEIDEPSSAIRVVDITTKSHIATPLPRIDLGD